MKKCEYRAKIKELEKTIVSWEELDKIRHETHKLELNERPSWNPEKYTFYGKTGLDWRKRALKWEEAIEKMIAAHNALKIAIFL